jgi:endonuclease YncB( thermonuclease family)
MRLILNYAFAVIVLLLFGGSAFFTARVLLFKRGLRTDASVSTIKSGQRARVVTVVDGDDLVVQADGETIRVRMLGLYTYDATLSDPLVASVAQQTLRHLEQTMIGKDVELVFDELKYDSKHRLLCYLHRGEQDLGLEMISKGLALAYTKYPFSRVGSYVLGEDQAREAKVGLWADPQLAQRSRQLRMLWETQRRNGD